MLDTRMARPARIPAVAAATWGLRTYRWTALLLALVGSAGLAATMAVSRLSGAGGEWWATILRFSTVPATDLGPGTSRAVQGPAVAQQAIVDLLFPLLLLAAGLGLVAGWITLLALSHARAEDRRVEIAVRRAVGASRGSLLAGLGLEGAATAGATVLLGGLGGLLLAWLALYQWPGLSGAGGAGLTWAVIGSVALGLGLGALMPLAYARGREVPQAFDQPHGLGGATAQLGLSLAVLTAGGLMAGYAAKQLKAPPSGRLDGRLYSITAPRATDSARAAGYANLLATLGDQGLGTVSLTSPGVRLGLGSVDGLTTECGECYLGGIYLRFKRVRVTHHVVSADTFAAIGARVVAGRTFAATDTIGGLPVAVVNQAMAYANFQGGDAVGREIFLGPGLERPHTVIGIVADPPRPGFGSGQLPPGTVYLSILQHPVPDAELLIRPGGHAAAGGDAAAERAVRRALGGVGPSAIRDETAVVATESAPVRWFSRWMALEGWAMLLVAVVGTFAAMRLRVLSLMPELGVRRALGARRWQLMIMVAGDAVGVGVRGTIVGIAVGWVVWSTAAVYLSGFPVFDGRLILSYGLLLTLVALAGVLRPAWKAMRLGPAVLIGVRE